MIIMVVIQKLDSPKDVLRYVQEKIIDVLEPLSLIRTFKYSCNWNFSKTPLFCSSSTHDSPSSNICSLIQWNCKEQRSQSGICYMLQIC